MSGVLPAVEPNTGARILLIAAAAALAIAIFNFFWPGNGIHGTAGAGLVVISSALMAASTAALIFAARMGRGLRGTLLVLIALDIVGTGLAAYLLEAGWLIAVMAVALVGWIVVLATDRPLRRPAGEPIAQRGAQ
jgi:quinoprotein glucose dehydrogenase